MLPSYHTKVHELWEPGRRLIYYLLKICWIYLKNAACGNLGVVSCFDCFICIAITLQDFLTFPGKWVNVTRPSFTFFLYSCQSQLVCNIFLGKINWSGIVSLRKEWQMEYESIWHLQSMIGTFCCLYLCSSHLFLLHQSTVLLLKALQLGRFWKKKNH